MLKSAGIVLGSYVLSIALVLATDALLSVLFPGNFFRGRIPSDAALVASTAFFVAISLLCAWLCARFAPSNPTRHVFWFFVIGEAMGIGSTAVNWNNGWPHWYFVAWLLTWPMSCILGLLLITGRGFTKSPRPPHKAGLTF